MKRISELLFIRRMLENMLDQGERAVVDEMSQRIDRVMLQRIQQEAAETAATL